MHGDKGDPFTCAQCREVVAAEEEFEGEGICKRCAWANHDEALADRADLNEWMMRNR